MIRSIIFNCLIIKNEFSCFYRMPAPAPAAAPEPNIPKTELQELQIKAQHQTDEVSYLNCDGFNLN